MPSDIGVLLVSALLVREGPLDALTLGVAATLGNTAGSLIPWWIARHFGPRFARSRTGRRLLPPDLVSYVEREYVRFGLPGIFLCRLLPGIRFIVAPFAGLVGLGPVRTLVPLSLAAGVWYAAIIGGGWLIGGERAVLLRFLRELNLGLALLAALAILTVVLWWWRRRRQLAEKAGARLLAAFEAAVAEVRHTPRPDTEPIPLAATTVLLVELAGIDESFDPAALEALEAHAKERWGLGPLVRGATMDVDFLTHARTAAAATDHTARIALAAQVWQLTLVDGTLLPYESALLARMADFLSLTAEDVVAAKQQAERALGAGPR